jgi:hypothetical protein
VQLVLGTGIASCGLADLVLLLLSDSIGTTERIRVLLTSGWFLAVGLSCSARRGSASGVMRSSRAAVPAAASGLVRRCVEGESAHSCQPGDMEL